MIYSDCLSEIIENDQHENKWGVQAGSLTKKPISNTVNPPIEVVCRHYAQVDIVSNFLRMSAYQIEHLAPGEQAKISHAAVDMVTRGLDTIKPGGRLSHNREQALIRVKTCIEQHLRNPELDATMIAGKVGMSPRYINSLFAAGDTSLMRCVLQRRLECCHRELSATGNSSIRVSEVAFRYGFNESSHFSRVFKQRYGITPRQLSPP